jgi:pimeloyl-ACP methyl ester carboxylesterase
MDVTTDALPAVEGVRHRWVTARGARFHVAEAGPTETGSPPIVLLHGWPQHWYMWRHAIPALAAAGAHVIVPDLRGFGWSDVTRRGYRKDELAADVLAILDGLGVQRFAVAGHDWGGYAAFLLALDHPERVTRLVLLNTGHGYPKRDLKTLRAQLSFWYMPFLGAPLLGPALVRRAAAGKLPSRMLGQIDEAWSDEDRHWFLGRTSPHATQQVYGTFVFSEAPRAATRRERRRLKPPALVLHGDADPAIRPDFIRGIEDHADDVRVELLPGLGHFSLEQGPDVVVPRLVEFLT